MKIEIFHSLRFTLLSIPYSFSCMLTRLCSCCRWNMSLKEERENVYVYICVWCVFIVSVMSMPLCQFVVLEWQTQKKKKKNFQLDIILSEQTNKPNQMKWNEIWSANITQRFEEAEEKHLDNFCYSHDLNIEYSLAHSTRYVLTLMIVCMALGSLVKILVLMRTCACLQCHLIFKCNSCCHIWLSWIGASFSLSIIIIVFLRKKPLKKLRIFLGNDEMQLKCKLTSTNKHEKINK